MTDAAKQPTDLNGRSSPHPVAFTGAPPPPGTIIRLGEREAGEMRSGIDGQGLALLRLEQVAKARAEGAPLMAGATEILPQEPACSSS